MPLILIIIGVALIIYNYRAITRENAMEQKDDSLNISFQSILQDNKEELSDYKMDIGLLRRDIAESLTELQEEIIDIKNNLNRLNNNDERYENKEELEKKHLINKIVGEADEVLYFESDTDEQLISKIGISEKSDSSKTQKIKKLLKEGLTEEEICHELSVSKGEVLLVKGLFKK